MWMVMVVAMLLIACGSGRSFGKVDAGAVVIEGRVDTDYFVRQLEQLDPWFEACYARTLRRNRDAEGVITLRMRGKDGMLDPDLIANETGNAELANCVTNAVSNLAVVEPTGAEAWDFTAEWPITFSIMRGN
jgi:hypothetical protein